MAKAYWIGIVDVKNQEEYKKYADIAGPALINAGAKILSRGGKIKNLEGKKLIVRLLLNSHQWMRQKNFMSQRHIKKD